MDKEFNSNAKYTIEFQLSYIKELSQAGSFSSIKLYKDIELSRYIVSKFFELPTELEENADFFTEKFKDEARFLIETSHENIVNAFLFGKSKTLNKYYYLMEYIEGDTLDNYISENPDRINNLFIEICKTFEWLHSKGILHRDVKENNIIVTKEGVVKIIDFGLSKINNNSDSFSVINNVKGLNRTYSEEEWKKEYTMETEVFHIGKMFERIAHSTNKFKYHKIINNMIINNKEERLTLEKIINMATNISEEMFHLPLEVQEAVDNIINNYPIRKFIGINPEKTDISLEMFNSQCNNFITSNFRAVDFYKLFINNSKFRYNQNIYIEKKHIKILIDFIKSNPSFYYIFKQNIFKLINNTEVEYDDDELPF